MFIKIKVFPKAKKQKVVKISDEKLEVFVKSTTERNQANLEMLELVTGFLEIEQKNVRIISGHHRPNKMIKIKK